MLILHEGELLHTDSSTDVLERYGVKGMKWGKRLRSAATAIASNDRVRATGRYLKDYGKEYKKAVGKSYTNPLISKKAGRVTSKAAMKRANDYVDDRVDLKDRHKVNQRKTKGVKNKVNNYIQYRHDVSDMSNKYAGRKGY